MSDLYSWGRYPHNPQRGITVYWEDEIVDALTRARDNVDGSTLVYGCGRSYGDVCLAVSDTVLQMQGLDRVLKVDWQTGSIRAQSALTIAGLIELALPHGWFPAVTPGTKFVTLGGAVANDIHGKNHHRVGTFGCHVKSICLYRSDLGIVECSREQNADLFAATIGGLGLTGVILWVEIQLMRVASSNVLQRTIKFPRLARFFELASDHDADHGYSVSWIDCLASGEALGRGHYIVADHVDGDTAMPDRDTRLTVPVDPPFSLVNSWSTRIFNALYYRKVLRHDSESVLDYRAYFYPLDGISNWNRIYGRRGFQQFQCVIPSATAQETITTLIDVIRQFRSGSFLSVLKCCGSIPSPGLISFPLEGMTLALDFPQSEKLQILFRRLDELVHAAGGRLYPAKDAHMQKEHFQDAYPNWNQVEAQRDPALISKFWKRVSEA